MMVMMMMMMIVWVQGLGRSHCDGSGGLAGPGSLCYRANQHQHHDDSRSVRSDDGDPRPGSGSRSDLNDSHCGLGDDSDAGCSFVQVSVFWPTLYLHSGEM